MEIDYKDRRRNPYKYMTQEQRLKYKKEAAARTKVTREANREFIVLYLTQHPCVDCGETDLVCLDFDHLGDKEYLVCKMLNHSRKRLEKEIAKCEVVCANCHRRRTASRAGDWYKTGLPAKEESTSIDIA